MIPACGTTMEEAAVDQSTDPEPRCRLCLQWADEEDDTDRGLQCIFTEDDDSLPFKIRDCVGVFVSPEDSIRTICSNCRQTVCFIDEFRTLCRQTEEIYESVQIRCEDSERWERYGEYVGELRKLVQDYKDTINEQLVGVEDMEGEKADQDSISQLFVPMMMVKEEPEEDEEGEDVEPMAIELLEIKPDQLLMDESGEAYDGEEESETLDEIGPSSYEKQVQLAQEVLKRLKQFTSKVANHNQLWAEIAEQLDMEHSATKTCWNWMQQNYLASKASAATASRRTILRLSRCQLFNLMNQIVPELEVGVLPWVAPNNEQTDSQGSCKSFPMDLRIAIAEEIRKYPVIWNKSIGSSTYKIDRAWKTIAKKFNLDLAKLRLHWRSLRDLFRVHKKRVSAGASVRTKSDKQYYKLIGILEEIYIPTRGFLKRELETGQTVFMGNTEDTVSVELDEPQQEEDSEESAMETSDDQKMYLAKLVYKHPYLWNKKHQDFHNVAARDATWDRIAAKVNKTRDDTKYAWKCLRDLYRGRVKRKNQGLLPADAGCLQDPLFKQLELMCSGNMRFGSLSMPAERQSPLPGASQASVEELESDAAPEGNDADDYAAEGEGDENMKLLELCEKHKIIWHSRHPDHSNLEKRDLVWDTIAQKLNLTRAQVKATWTRLRNVYRCRTLRFLKGNIPKSSHLLRAPLYRKLDAMLKEHMQLGKYGGGIGRSVDSEQPLEQLGRGNNEPFPGMEDKVKLAEEVIKHEYLWNGDHPDFHNAILRDQAWLSIAASLNQSSSKVKYAYKLMRDSYRCRMKRINKTNADPSEYFEHDPLFHKMHIMFSNSMRYRRSQSNNSADMAFESDSNDVLEDHDDADTEHDIDETLQLAMLCEKQELIWNSKHPDHMHHEKREAIWINIAQEMNRSKFYVKEMWTRLRNVYRTRTLRYLRGSITKKNHLLRDPLYQKLHAMLNGNMQLGKYGGGFLKKDAPKKEPSAVGPFHTMESKVLLVKEVFKHEHLWNTQHVDYFKSDKRGATWKQIAETFDNCNVWTARSEWRRLRDMHRPRKSRAAHVRHPFLDDIEREEEEEPPVNDPLYELFSKMAGRLLPENDLAEEGESSGTQKVKKRRLQEFTEEYMTYKRRYTGKRSFDNAGCIKVTRGGIVRYEKVCELCGKQIERSYFEYHMNQHNGVKPYACSYEGCDRQYSNKITRDRHEILIHCEDNYKYECDQCDEKFKFRSTFDYHYAIKHESQQVPCTICGKLLKHKTLLREHLRRHTGHFPCPVCGKILQKKYSLDVHMRTHTNEKPYPCELCGQSFMLKVQMKTHLAKVHDLSWEDFQAIYGGTSQQ